MKMPSLQRFFTRVVDRVKGELTVAGWRRQLAALRAEGSSIPAKRTVLFSAVMTMPATAKMESLLAGLLRLKGYRALVVLRRPDHVIERIFQAGAIEVEFIYLDREIRAQERKEAAAKATDIVAGLKNLRDLLALQIDGFRIGINVLSIVLRQFRVGVLSDTNEAHRSSVVGQLTQSLAVKSYVERLLRQRRVDIAIFNERGYTPAGEIFDGCTLAGVDTIQWCGAPQADRLVFRRYKPENRDEHPLTFSTDTWNSLVAMPWPESEEAKIPRRIREGYESGTWGNKQQLQDGKDVIDKDLVRKRLGLAPDKKTVVIFSHIFYDATFFYGTALFDDFEHWLIETVRVAIANPRLNWVIKVHPVNVWRSRMDGAPMEQLEEIALRAEFGELPSHIKLLRADTEISTYSLFEAADYGITVRGTVGMELPCFGIPVVTAGSGRYSGRGTTIDPKTRLEYEETLARLQEVPRLSEHQMSLARRLYFASFELFPAPMISFVLDFFASPGPAGTYLPDLYLKAHGDSRLLQSPDLGCLIRWATESKTAEFLAQSEKVSGVDLQ